MCGIAGIVSLSGSPVPDLGRRLTTMQARLEHRGPDGKGIWYSKDDRVGLAHTRLKIIDLEGGHQPMSWEGNEFVTYNGEIYNYPELGKELGRQGHPKSDTTVLLHAYRTWGRACVERFRGIFAFAVWYHRNQTLFCARDRFGIKPFYYT